MYICICDFVYTCTLLIKASPRDYVTKQIFRSFNFCVRAFSAVSIAAMHFLHVHLHTYIHTYTQLTA